MNQSINSDYINKIKILYKNKSLPEEVIAFLESMLSLPFPPLRKKISYTFDALQHASGKSIVTREALFPYAKLSKAEERLQQLVGMEFSPHLQKTHFVENIQKVAKYLNKEKKFAKKLLQAYLEEQESFYQEQAEISSEFAFMCYFLAYFTFMPFFAHSRGQIDVTYDTDIWAHGHCPYCGSMPHLSYLKEKEGKRMHACPTCLGIYRVPRIQCPYCLEQKQEKLTYFTTDTVKEAQVCVCASCKNYMKICDAREYEKFAPLTYVDDFKTVLLDLMASQQGYENPVVSLWLS